MKDHSEFVILLDRSGSMQDAKDDHIGGLKSFIEDQKKLEGDVRITLIQFDTQAPCEVLYSRTPIEQVEEVDLVPRGGTPLLDAIGLGIAHYRQSLGEDKPDQVIVMIITDGQENSSREFTRERVRSLIAEQEAKGWTFLYLGANVDAFAEAGQIGVRTDYAANYSVSEVKTSGGIALYGNLASNATRARTNLQHKLQANAGAGRSLSAEDLAEVQANFGFSAQQRKEMTGDDHAS